MIVPIRCFSCGRLIAHQCEEFVKRAEKERAEKVLDELGVDRYCCRRMLLAHIDLIDEIMKYNV
jgi:DNA-directed RNA polymerase subunit N